MQRSNNMKKWRKVMNPDSAKVLIKATLNAAKALGLNKRELATAIGMSVQQLDKPDSAFQPGTEAGQRCLLLIRVHEALASQLGHDQEQVGLWLRSHNSAIDEIPLVAISTQEGLIKVVAYLEHLLERG
ncbi:MAG: DUF2384 domain-containing protein [Hylemonella sp.]|nr:DUF2384 domain-containing protein [Hylemonella sp.]